MVTRDVPLCKIKTLIDSKIEHDEKTDVFFVEVSGVDHEGEFVKSIFGIFGTKEKAESARSCLGTLIG